MTQGRKFISPLILIILISIFAFSQESKLINLVPNIQGWSLIETPQIFHPENLYKYIDGGAEAYLAYDFKELIVAEFKNSKNASIIIEIYNMGNEKNSFGIYSLERSPDSNYILIGNHGYIDGESLNFIVSTYYIKINCFDCGENTQNYLLNFAKEIINKIKDKGSLPFVLGYFPQRGLIKNSEKFYLKNFLGLDFLKNGYQAEYNLNNQNFYLFIIECKNEQDAQDMSRKLKNHFKNNLLQKISINNNECYLIEDRYYKQILFTKAKNFIVGSLKLENINMAKELISSILLKIKE